MFCRVTARHAASHSQGYIFLHNEITFINISFFWFTYLIKFLFRVTISKHFFSIYVQRPYTHQTVEIWNRKARNDNLEKNGLHACITINWKWYVFENGSVVIFLFKHSPLQYINKESVFLCMYVAFCYLQLIVEGINTRPVFNSSPAQESAEYANLGESIRATGADCLGVVNLPVRISLFGCTCT